VTLAIAAAFSFPYSVKSLFATAAIVTGLAASVTPEPMTWALMLVGFAGMGALLRANSQRQLAPVRVPTRG